jgi:CubicO group peptidase (beta-lactamase class C family)
MNPSDHSGSNSIPPATFRPGQPDAESTPAPVFAVPGFRTSGLPAAASRWSRAAIGDIAPGPGFGFGLGVQVLKDPAAAQSPLHAGAWNWGGVYGTHYWVDPAEGLSFVALTNTAVAGMFGAFPSALQRAIFPA